MRTQLSANHNAHSTRTRDRSMLLATAVACGLAVTSHAGHVLDGTRNWSGIGIPTSEQLMPCLLGLDPGGDDNETTHPPETGEDETCGDAGESGGGKGESGPGNDGAGASGGGLDECRLDDSHKGNGWRLSTLPLLAEGTISLGGTSYDALQIDGGACDGVSFIKVEGDWVVVGPLWATVATETPECGSGDGYVIIWARGGQSHQQHFVPLGGGKSALNAGSTSYGGQIDPILLRWSRGRPKRVRGPSRLAGSHAR